MVVLSEKFLLRFKQNFENRFPLNKNNVFLAKKSIIKQHSSLEK